MKKSIILVYILSIFYISNSYAASYEDRKMKSSIKIIELFEKKNENIRKISFKE